MSSSNVSALSPKSASSTSTITLIDRAMSSESLVHPPRPARPSSPRLSSSSAPAKAKDILFGGNKSRSQHNIGADNTGASVAAAADSPRASTSRPHTPSGLGRTSSGKLYDVLGESKSVVDRFIGSPKAFHTLGIGQHKPTANSSGAESPDTLRWQFWKQQMALSQAANIPPLRTPANAQQIRANVAQSAVIAPSSSSSSSSPPPPSAPPSQIPNKARDVLFGRNSHQSKSLDRLGVTTAMIRRFRSQPKAFQRLGLFDAQPQSERRTNINGVVISGMREIKNGTLFLLSSSSIPLRSVRPRYCVLTLDALTWYRDESEMNATGFVSLLNGALVRYETQIDYDRHNQRRSRSAERGPAFPAAAAYFNQESHSDDEKAVASVAHASPSQATTAPRRSLYGFSLTSLDGTPDGAQRMTFYTETSTQRKQWMTAIIGALKRKYTSRRRNINLLPANNSLSLSTENVSYENYIFQLINIGLSRHWVSRYWILFNNEVTIFKTIDDKIAQKEPIIILRVDECTLTIDHDPLSQQIFVFSITQSSATASGAVSSSPLVVMAATSTDVERGEWINAFHRAVGRTINSGLTGTNSALSRSASHTSPTTHNSDDAATTTAAAQNNHATDIEQTITVTSPLA